MENDIKDYKIKALKREILINNLKAWIVGIILIAQIIFIGALFAKSGYFIGKTSASDNKVGVLRYNKAVTEEFTTKIMEKMDKLRNDKSYKEILFIMGSPGGSPTASEELSEYLKAYQKDKNITMYVESIAASGGYYIASAIKPLVANKNAIIGSIGVIMPHYNLGELAKKIGIEEDYLAAGEYKKPISVFEKIDDENREYMTKHLIKPAYENFINAVASNRGIMRDKLLPFTEGKIYIANAPEIQGVLVDKISSLYKIKNELREKHGKNVQFVKIETEKKFPFLPEVKLSLDIEALKTGFGLK